MMNHKVNIYQKNPSPDMKLAQLKEWVNSHQMTEKEQMVILTTLVKKLDSVEPLLYTPKKRTKKKLDKFLTAIILFAVVYVIFATIMVAL